MRRRICLPASSLTAGVNPTNNLPARPFTDRVRNV
jgi:hypothetical protein